MATKNISGIKGELEGAADLVEPIRNGQSEGLAPASCLKTEAYA
jgi:hypothetical protein